MSVFIIFLINNESHMPIIMAAIPKVATYMYQWHALKLPNPKNW